jgi:methionine synthase II (cobalamin-independent)
LPKASVVLQIDEPSLPAVLAGRIPTESGFGTLRAVETADARSHLASIVDAVAVPVIVHCCAPDVPVDLVRTAGAVAIALDLSLLRDLDPIGEALDAGMGLVAGASGTTAADVAGQVERFWKRLGFPLERLPEQVVVSPPCGLAGVSWGDARAALTAAREAAARLRRE